ncbi:hypothetical protein NDU88_002297 [Pleurodeles waltl]|uniref:Uncharacterized protein n=1 Tax=Pleurodeles waltl TaxID=8319 RepID=A0AAV7W457_PLEWA|nr:hypothetical protein NDU88_002297 [Pleurodeles waltl]
MQGPFRGSTCARGLPRARTGMVEQECLGQVRAPHEARQCWAPMKPRKRFSLGPTKKPAVDGRALGHGACEIFRGDARHLTWHGYIEWRKRRQALIWPSQHHRVFVRVRARRDQVKVPISGGIGALTGRRKELGRGAGRYCKGPSGAWQQSGSQPPPPTLPRSGATAGVSWQ